MGFLQMTPADGVPSLFKFGSDAAQAARKYLVEFDKFRAQRAALPGQSMVNIDMTRHQQ